METDSVVAVNDADFQRLILGPIERREVIADVFHVRSNVFRFMGRLFAVEPDAQPRDTLWEC
jgi:hypothetical protein